MGAHRYLVVEMNIRILVPFLAGKSGRDQALADGRRLRDLHFATIQLCAAALLRREHLIARWIEHYCRNALALFSRSPYSFYGHGNTKYRISVREVRRSIQRIDIPPKFTPRLGVRSFFAGNVVLGPLCPNA